MFTFGVSLYGCPGGLYVIFHSACGMLCLLVWDQHFDLTMAGYVLSELGTDADREKMVRELWERTSPGGVMVRMVQRLCFGPSWGHSLLCVLAWLCGATMGAHFAFSLLSHLFHVRCVCVCVLVVCVCPCVCVCVLVACVWLCFVWVGWVCQMQVLIERGNGWGFHCIQTARQLIIDSQGIAGPNSFNSDSASAPKILAPCAHANAVRVHCMCAWCVPSMYPA